MNRLARKSVLSSKAADGSLIVVEDFSFDAPQTKAFVEILGSLKVDGKKTLLVTSDHEKNVFLSSRNVPKAKVMRAQDLNTYDILHANTILLSEGAVEKIVKNV